MGSRRAREGKESGPVLSGRTGCPNGQATLVGLACYQIFYRLEPTGYCIGMVQLAVEGVVATILAATVTLTRVP